MSLSFETVDAFTTDRFTGNPASVVVLPIDSNYDVSSKFETKF